MPALLKGKVVHDALHWHHQVSEGQDVARDSLGLMTIRLGRTNSTKPTAKKNGVYPS